MVLDYCLDRLQMIREHLKPHGIDDEQVLSAMYNVPRHKFMHPKVIEHSYHDHASPIEESQTISQPFVVAATVQLSGAKSGQRVLDIGTGSGYQAAVLAAMGVEVYSIEINESLAGTASERLARLGYKVKTKVGDGYYGWPEKAPFDAIVVAAAPVEIPPALKEQLVVGGKLVIPVGSQDSVQNLFVLTRTEEGFKQAYLDSVTFVPMTGEAERKRVAETTAKATQILIARR